VYPIIQGRGVGVIDLSGEKWDVLTMDDIRIDLRGILEGKELFKDLNFKNMHTVHTSHTLPVEERTKTKFNSFPTIPFSR